MLQRLKTESKTSPRATPFVAIAIAAAVMGSAQLYMRSVEAMPITEMTVIRVMVENVAARWHVNEDMIWHQVITARGVPAPSKLLRRDYEPALDMLVMDLSLGK